MPLLLSLRMNGATMTDAAPAQPAAATPWRLVLLLGALTAFAPMSIDMYLSSMPEIGRQLHAGADDVQATLAAFFAGMAIGQFLYGPASDRLGRRGPLLLGIGIYVAASVVCALAPSIQVLVAARFVQALGGCAGAAQLAFGRRIACGAGFAQAGGLGVLCVLGHAGAPFFFVAGAGIMRGLGQGGGAGQGSCHGAGRCQKCCTFHRDSLR